MTFWLGDLNYRLNDLEVSEVKEQLEEGSLSLLLESDQFSLQRQQRKAFVGYKEGPIKFRPTYKYDPSPRLTTGLTRSSRSATTNLSPPSSMLV